MIVTPIKTDPIVLGALLFPVLDQFLPPLHNGDIVAITSKIISICEGRIQAITTEEEKQRVIREESERYIDTELTRRYGFQLTIAHNILIPNAGVDESNGNGQLILWPKDAMRTAQEVWEYLRKKFSLTRLGVIITDSHTTMLRKGTMGIGLSWCGFEALKNYIGTPDIFKRELRVTKSHVLDGLAASAVLVMGEGNEQTPMAVIQEAHNVVFQDHPPTREEIQDIHIPVELDLYAPLLLTVPWQKGGRS